MSPDPKDASSFNHRFVTVPSGHRYHLVDQPPAHWRGPIEEAPTVLMLHGFPDNWSGWRYQIVAFAARGYRVLCPSQLGYCGTSQPTKIEAYSFKSIAYDYNGLLDAVGAGRVVVCGHDWGAFAAWRFANFFPHRVICLASVCVPYAPPSQPGDPIYSDADLLRKVPNFGYQIWFKDEETSAKIDEVLEQFITVSFSPTLRAKLRKAGKEIPQMAVEGNGMEKRVDEMIRVKRAGKAPPVPQDPCRRGRPLRHRASLSAADSPLVVERTLFARPQELLYYIETFKKHGMHAPLNWYRNRTVSALDEQASHVAATFPAHIPALLLPAENDPALPPAMSDPKRMAKLFPGGNLRIEVIKGADHWALQDEPFRDGVTDRLLSFVEEVLAGKWQPEAPPSKL
ncbi:Alpha/Beta hydrolase protein [Rhodotorula diobovata]|uniref:Alpha/Beta hydrolase protein n=1 Tax=Rhodotorula diobovata TaxID=5288 RepID=A0A5C5FRQ4_9BASI|nr:Alpha/Beta hydrolase protein [Rhodotorula diobovata]